MLQTTARAADEEAGGSNFNPGDYLNAAEDVNGWTPLHLAAVGEYLDVMYLLMEAGCNPNVKDKVKSHCTSTLFRAKWY